MFLNVGYLLHILKLILFDNITNTTALIINLKQYHEMSTDHDHAVIPRLGEIGQSE